MARTLTRNFVTLVLLILPLSLWADSNLDYQNRGDRFEGIRSKPVSVWIVPTLVATRTLLKEAR